MPEHWPGEGYGARPYEDARFVGLMRCALCLLLVVGVCLCCAACGGSHRSFSVGEVERVFAQQGLPVAEGTPVKQFPYRGETHGVEMTLARSTLTLRFGPGSEAIRERALATKNLQVFCFWPEGRNGKASSETGVRLSPAKRTQVIAVGASGSSAGYSCALSAPPQSSPKWPATKFLSQALVSAHLVRSRHVLKPSPASLFGLPPATERALDRHVRAVLGATNRRTFATRLVYVFDSAASLQRARRLVPRMLTDRKGSRTAKGNSTSESACAMNRKNVFALASFQYCTKLRVALADLH